MNRLEISAHIYDSQSLPEPKRLGAHLRPISGVPRKPAPHQPRNQRDELLEYFTNAINQRREGTQREPYTIPRMSRKLRGLSEHELTVLQRACEEARSFTKCFFGTLKARN